MASLLYLPSHLAAIDLGESLDLGSDALRAARPPWLNPRHPAADRALRYGRGRGGLPYDEIAERVQAALPGPPATALHTRATVRRHRADDEAHRRNADIDTLIDQIETLRHRALELPLSRDVSYDIAGGEELVTFYARRNDGGQDAWTFSFAHPPQLLCERAFDANAWLLPTQGYRIDFPGVFWLPLAVLIEGGRFPRFQHTRDRLVSATEPGSFYLFISHRWLARDEPDPDGVQARFFAWQFISYLCEALEIAADRGRDRPRQASALVNRPIGRFGSELAECLLMNLVLGNMDDARLASAMLEISEAGDRLDNRGSSAADADVDLRELRDLLDRMPVVRDLVRRSFVWYDYSCLPQSPRAADDEPLFRQGLEHLNHIQVMGATAILLDEVDDYLGRAWCVLESVSAEDVAASGGGSEPFLLAASRRSTNRSGKAEHYYTRVLRDCRHLVWRAVLDTEVFASQTSERCMERLGLAVSDPADLPFVYGALSRRGAPDAPTDDYEVVTGAFPLPFASDGASVHWRRHSGRTVASAPEPAATVTLDWTAALRPHTALDVDEPRPIEVPPVRNLLGSNAALFEREGYEGLHLVVVGSCEGEAMLFANWTYKRRADVEQVVGVPPVSISWLSTDIAPIGTMPYGNLKRVGILSQRWVVIATESRLRSCEVTGHVIEMLRALGRPYGELALDRREHNLRWFAGRTRPDPPESLASYRASERLSPQHQGGLFRAALLEHLLPACERVR
jgi:hypothetical protein